MSSNGWQRHKLGEIAEIIMGQSPAGETCNETGDGVPLLNGPTEFGDFHPKPVQYTTDPKKFSKVGDILFCVRGSTTGRMNWADQEYAIGRGLAAIRHKKGKEFQPFLKGILDYYLPYLLTEATGSTFPNVSSRQLSSLVVEVPPLPIQRRIADILSALDEKIELNRQTNATLEAIAQAIFREWFVEFKYPVWNYDLNDSMKTMIAGGENHSPSGNQKNQSADMVESELGPIPRGWRVGRLGEVCKKIKNTVHPKDVEPTTAYVGLEHIPRKSLGLTSWGNSDDVDSQKTQFKKFDILFGKLRPYFHKVCIAPVDGICSTDILVIEPLKKEFFSFCLNHLFGSELITYVSAVADGTRMPRVDWNSISNYRIVVPPENLLAHFNKVTFPFYKKIIENNQQSVTLASLRDALLPKLMSGEIEVMS